MREDVANFVHPVFSYGLNLKERLELGERPDFEAEYAKIMGLLNSLGAKGLPEYAGDDSFGTDPSVTMAGSGTIAGRPGLRGGSSFRGIRYAMACWLDELFILDLQVPPDGDQSWSREWDNRKMEWELYRTNIRATEFWVQADRAAARSSPDALEVFFLCVMLGFRGERRERPDVLAQWIANTQSRIASNLGKQEIVKPPLGPIPGDFTPLRGRERFQVMCRWLGLVILIAIVVAVPFLVYLFRGSS